MSEKQSKRLLVTGGAGFIGSAFIRFLLTGPTDVEKVVNLDLLTYAANLQNLASVDQDKRYLFVRGDICNSGLIEELCRTHQIDTIVHFAAESHVDRSIDNPQRFYHTNVAGTICLLEVVRRLPDIHFHHVSTDEVFGSIEEGAFTEASPYKPNSPYAASKAASDHFVRAYAHTYGISITLSHCTNNFGPGQHEEKFIPRMIMNCLKRKPLPVYGRGINVRDWLYVDDHAEAIWLLIQKGRRGESYNIGASCEKRNIDLLYYLIERVAHFKGEDAEVYRSFITFVTDRPGHDMRYALQSSKIFTELNWQPRHSFEESLDETIQWFLQY